MSDKLELNLKDEPTLTIAPVMLLPAKLYLPNMRVVADPNIRDDRAYISDGKGNIHYFAYMGMNLNAKAPEP